MLHLAILATIVLAARRLRGMRLVSASALFLGIGLLISVGPVDAMLRPAGHVKLRVLRAQYGPRCTSGFACYGCLVPLVPAEYAIVLEY